jgi:hypothetical protein
VFRGDGDGGAAEGVVEPGVFSVGRSEEAFEIERGSDARDEGAGPVEESEETVPIDGEEEGMIGSEEGSAGRKGDGAAFETGDGEGDDGIGLRELGNEDEFAGLSLNEDLKKVRLQERFEAAFDRHPDGLGFEIRFQRVAAGRVGEVIGERADGGEQRLMDARTVSETGLRGDLGPGNLRAGGQYLRVVRVLARGTPGEGVGDADEGMKNDKDGFEESAVGFHQRHAVWRIGELLRLHLVG